MMSSTHQPQGPGTQQPQQQQQFLSTAIGGGTQLILLAAPPHLSAELLLKESVAASGVLGLGAHYHHNQQQQQQQQQSAPLLHYVTAATLNDEQLQRLAGSAAAALLRPSQAALLTSAGPGGSGGASSNIGGVVNLGTALAGGSGGGSGVSGASSGGPVSSSGGISASTAAVAPAATPGVLVAGNRNSVASTFGPHQHLQSQLQQFHQHQRRQLQQAPLPRHIALPRADTVQLGLALPAASAPAAVLISAAEAAKLQENHVVDFLSLADEVQFIKTEDAPASSPPEMPDFAVSSNDSGVGDVGARHTMVPPVPADMMEPFADVASPLLHESSKDVTLSTLQQQQQQQQQQHHQQQQQQQEHQHRQLRGSNTGCDTQPRSHHHQQCASTNEAISVLPEHAGTEPVHGDYDTDELLLVQLQSAERDAGLVQVRVASGSGHGSSTCDSDLVNAAAVVASCDESQLRDNSASAADAADLTDGEVVVVDDEVSGRMASDYLADDDPLFLERPKRYLHVQLPPERPCVADDRTSATGGDVAGDCASLPDGDAVHCGHEADLHQPIIIANGGVDHLVDNSSHDDGQMDCTSTNLVDVSPPPPRANPIEENEAATAVSRRRRPGESANSDVAEVTSTTTVEPPPLSLEVAANPLAPPALTAASPVKAVLGGDLAAVRPSPEAEDLTAVERVMQRLQNPQARLQQSANGGLATSPLLLQRTQPPPTVSIVDAVVSDSSSPSMQTITCPIASCVPEGKIRVLSLGGGASLLNVGSTGEPVLLGNILLVPETPTVRLQILQDDSSLANSGVTNGNPKELNLRATDVTTSGITLNHQLSLGLGGLGTLGNLNGLALATAGNGNNHISILTPSATANAVERQKLHTSSAVSVASANGRSNSGDTSCMSSSCTNNADVAGATVISCAPAGVGAACSGGNALVSAASSQLLTSTGTLLATISGHAASVIAACTPGAGAAAVAEQRKGHRPFQCKLCSATFNRLGNYTRHQRIHTVRCEEDERFHCEECGKSFIQRCDLTRHLHVHAGTEPHRCNLCGKGYIRRSDLVTHQRFHNKEKPFGCPHCQKGFSQRGDLNRHLRSIHLQIRPLTCGHCQKKFANEATLIRHMRTSHREMLLQSLLLKSGGEVSVSEALITGTGDICTPTTLTASPQ